MNFHSSNPAFNDTYLIDLELRCNGQSDAFFDDLDFILDEDGTVADGDDEVGILANHSSTSRRPCSFPKSDAMYIQEFDIDDTIKMSGGLNSYHISHLCQSDVYEVEFAPLEQLRQRQQHEDLSPCFRPSAHSAQFSDEKYNEALQKLAESMQRTEETRRQVILQRQILMPQPPLPSTERVDAGRSISPGRSSILNAFFSGSRCTLTNGLDQSRKQLSMYMTQMNQQTF